MMQKKPNGFERIIHDLMKVPLHKDGAGAMHSPKTTRIEITEVGKHGQPELEDPATDLDDSPMDESDEDIDPLMPKQSKQSKFLHSKMGK